MIILFMVVSFIIGRVDRMCQSFLQECAFCFSIIVLALSSWIFEISLPVGEKFF